MEEFLFPLNDLPSLPAARNVHWIGQGFLASTQRIEWDTPILGIVSSHSNANAFASAAWQAKLLSALRLAKQQGYTILYARETPYAIAIRTACTSMRIHAIELIVCENAGSVPTKSRDTVGPAIRSVNSLRVAILKITSKSIAPKFDALPIQDRAVIGLSRTVFALEIRPKGKISDLINLRLQDPCCEPASVLLAIQHDLSIDKTTRAKNLCNDLLKKGAVGWLCPSQHSNEQIALPTPFSCRSLSANTTVPIFRAALWNPLSSRFLLHCTRARRGPWPDQSLDQFHDEIFESPWKCQPSPIESLVRILEKQRLVATSSLKPSNRATVSFSACSLHELLACRRFEQHLARWDWEPYGIMVSADWLISQGCREVQYYTKAEMKSLTEEQSVFAQVYSETGTGRDWRVEREWRTTDDVRLHRLPFSQGIVFVPTVKEAHRIAHLSRWPICVVEPTT